VLVLDASACVPLALAGRLPDVLARSGLVAPPLLWSETTSALRELAWRGLITHDEATQAVGRIDSLGIELRHPAGLYGEALRVAHQLGWAKTYDAEYVALALLLASPLLTRDGRLRRGAGHVVTMLDPFQM
jgi:predicted nucleic acid-binding protein